MRSTERAPTRPDDSQLPAARCSLALLAALALLAQPAAAQVFQSSTSQIPQGSPDNNSYTENLDFADADLDGDWDVAFADGGEFGNDQNRFWINLGGLQVGVTGFFVDRTSSRMPAILDTSRDIEFVDIENDGDPDLYVSNSSAISNQSNRFLINVGGLQGGTLSFYVEETNTRYMNIAVNNGTTSFSSVAPSVALGSGGYIDWSCDSSFADLDADGDMDLVQSTYGTLSLGKVPVRLFLNDGDGHFEEYNPSGFQLTGTDLLDGNPGLWAEGTMLQNSTNTTGANCDIANTAISVDMGDLDGDLDLDIVQGHLNGYPHVYRNNLTENGGTLAPFRDITFQALPNLALTGRKYEQELGDLDGDDDLDLYGTNWSNTCDVMASNDGAGIFANPIAVAGSCILNNEPDYIDYDNDGDVDVLVASDSGQEQLYVNQGGALTLGVNLLPIDATNSLGVDAADMDNDGDYDAFVANDLGVANVFLENMDQTPDTHAPRLAKLEQAPDRAAGSAPTTVRVHVYDNQPTYISAFSTLTLEVSVAGSPFFEIPMTWSGAQVFRGGIPGALAGTIAYRVRATDRQGNSTLSASKSYLASSACPGTAATYCTSQMSSAGCTPAISWSGFASASAGMGFFLEASGVIAGNNGLIFYSRTGPNSTPFGGGTLCLASPVTRTGVKQASGSGLCGGLLRMDFNAQVAKGEDPALVAGQSVWAQWWWRDPAGIAGFNLTDAATFTLCQ